MRLQMTVRDLLVATWRVPAAGVARTLPAGLEPSLDEDGKALVSLVGLRNADVRAGGWRAPSFSQLGVRTYVTLAGAPAIFLLAIRVSLAGIGGVVFGMPLRPIRLRVRAGSVVAKGAGVRLRYRAIGEAAPDLFTFIGGACAPYVPGTGAVVHELGPPIPIATFTPGIIASER